MTDKMHHFLRMYLQDLIEDGMLGINYADYIGMEQEYRQEENVYDILEEELQKEASKFIDALIVLRIISYCTDSRPEETHEELKERMQMIHESVVNFLGDKK